MPMRKVIYVANWGTSREFIRDPKAGRTEYTQAAVPGSGKFVPPSITVYPANADQDVAPLRVIQGPKTGLDWPTNIAVDAKRGELYVANSGGHSVLVFDVNAQGDAAPIRVLKGRADGAAVPDRRVRRCRERRGLGRQFRRPHRRPCSPGMPKGTPRRSGSSAVRRAMSRRPASAIRTRSPTIRAAKK